jgi:hypothetical protein
MTGEISDREYGDYCPACGSDEIQPFAVIAGAAEAYGYQCLACTVTWPVLQAGTLPLLPPGARRDRAHDYPGAGPRSRA